VRDFDRWERGLLETFGSEFGQSLARRVIVQSAWEASGDADGVALILVNCSIERYVREREKTNGVVARSLNLSRAINIVSVQELLTLARLDGATIVSSGDNGLVIFDAGVYFRAPGGRHSSARFVCENSDWVIGAVIVSEDGPISVYGVNDPNFVGDDERFL
jgi:DNA integrity scanning protein DisA with diadenylate cyclase activity